MFWRIIRSRGVIPLVLIVGVLAYWKLHPRTTKVIEVGYVGDRSVTLWNTLAQVRQPIAELHYGDRIEIVREEGTSAQVQTASGVLGWLLDTRQIMNSDLWAESASLLAKARAMPVQARGQTKTVSNVRAEPGRNGKRIFQLQRGTPVVVLERTVADAAPASDETSGDGKNTAPVQQKPKQEDWLLVLSAGGPPLAVVSPSTEEKPSEPSRASGDPVSSGRLATQSGPEGVASSQSPIAGWVLARFIEPKLPGPVQDYASSADLHVVAWFELNRVPDGSGGETPQYLVAGSRGGEGQACDFTMLRVYTWGSARKRYETAYVESELCGRLPIRVSSNAAGPEFRFAEADGSPERMYVMRQTSIHRVKNGPSGNSTVQTKPKPN